MEPTFKENLDLIKRYEVELTDLKEKKKTAQEKFNVIDNNFRTLEAVIYARKMDLTRWFLKDFAWELIFQPNLRRREYEDPLDGFQNVQTNDFDLYTPNGYKNSRFKELWTNDKNVDLLNDGGYKIQLVLSPRCSIIKVTSSFDVFKKYIKEFGLKVDVGSVRSSFMNVQKVIDQIDELNLDVMDTK